MARDDYHVIVYQVLAYLYQCLKNGSQVDVSMLEPGSILLKQLNEHYWAYIIYNMSETGFIDGVVFAKLDGMRTPHPVDLKDCIITPQGIEYLCDNSFMKKAKAFLKDMKEITPFI